jgi:hypothetical protein
MTEHLKDMLRVRHDPQADEIHLTQGNYGYFLAVYPDGPHRGYSVSRFGETQHKPSEMWEILRGMQRAVEGIPWDSSVSHDGFSRILP